MLFLFIINNEIIRRFWDSVSARKAVHIEQLHHKYYLFSIGLDLLTDT
jgi:hypothetical protein